MVFQVSITVNSAVKALQTNLFMQVSSAMGFGFRCGFLGLLHMEIVQERLEREYDLDLIITAPTVVYRCVMANGEELTVDNPTKLPEFREAILEPYVRYPSCSLHQIAVLSPYRDTLCSALHVCRAILCSRAGLRALACCPSSYLELNNITMTGN